MLTNKNNLEQIEEHRSQSPPPYLQKKEWYSVQYSMAARNSSWKREGAGDSRHSRLQLLRFFGSIRLTSLEKIPKRIKTIKRCLRKKRSDALFDMLTLGIRAGNEKEQAATATVGCCTLQVRNIKLFQEERKYMVDLEFLGKDSIQFKKGFQCLKEPYKCLETFIAGKHRRDAVFDSITVNHIESSHHCRCHQC